MWWRSMWWRDWLREQLRVWRFWDESDWQTTTVALVGVTVWLLALLIGGRQ
jgi:hypothetical protein